MPEQDFELYLSLLSRFLRLKPAQHAEIADELRDHLEQRLEELSAQGLSHEEAIRKALDEFGDAAELANHFTLAAHIRRRRLIMRCTLGTIGTVAAALLVATAFWPATPHKGIAVQAIAENPPASTVAAAPSAGHEGRELVVEKWGFLRLDGASEQILAALDKPTEVNFVDLPLEDALNYLKEFHSINIWIDRAALADEGIQLDTPITLQHSGVSFRGTLKLMFQPLGLTYIVEDEVLKITIVKKATNVIAVYSIDGLVDGDAALRAEAARMGLTMGRSHQPSPDDEDAAASKETTPSTKRGTVPRKARVPIFYTSSLAELVIRTIAPDSWIEGGGDGSAIQYNRVLVVRNSQVVHEQVRSFLKLLRSTLSDTPEGQQH